MDIFLCGARKTEDSVGDEIQENLVIELKAPKVVLTKKVSLYSHWERAKSIADF